MNDSLAARRLTTSILLLGLLGRLRFALATAFPRDWVFWYAFIPWLGVLTVPTPVDWFVSSFLRALHKVTLSSTVSCAFLPSRRSCCRWVADSPILKWRKLSTEYDFHPDLTKQPVKNASIRYPKMPTVLWNICKSMNWCRDHLVFKGDDSLEWLTNNIYRPLSRRLDRCDRVIQDEVGDSNWGNV